MVNSQNVTKLLLSISATALMIGCSTSIAERSPLDIASNSLRRTDSYSGVSEVLAPQIKAFESNRTSVKGQVQLRTAGPFTDNNGIVHRDGAYLEIILDYATATLDPEGGLYFDQVNWAGGEAAQLADFGATVLDCQEDVREIYRVPIGYTGYGHYGGHYGQYGRHGYGGYGYDRHRRRGRHYGGYGRHGGGDHDRDNDDHRDDDHDDRPVGEHPTGNDMDTVSTPTRPTRPGVTRRDVTDDRSRVPAVRDPDRTTPRRRDIIRTGGDVIAPSRKQPRRRVPISTIKADTSTRVSRPATTAPTTRPSPSRVNRVSTPPPPPPPPPPARRQSSSKQNTSRSVDRAFKNTNNTRTRARSKVNSERRYDPQNRYNPGYTDYVVNYSCQRQESLRVFIPRERLLAAEKSGLLLYLKPQNGIEETVALPPNYISGFLLAAYSPDGQRLTIESTPRDTGSQATPPKPPNSKPEPSARTPIIYGGN